MITLSKIAKLAHVSVSTASKAFSMSNEVNEQTREQIFEIAKQYGCFKKFFNAKYPKYVIAVICPEFEGRYYSGIVSHLQKYLKELNCEVCVASTDFSPETENNLLQYYSNYTTVDGVIVVDNRTTFENIIELPVIAINSSFKSNCRISFSCDCKAPIAEAIEYFLSKNVDTIGFIGEEHTSTKLAIFKSILKDKVNEDYISITRERFETGGYIAMDKFFKTNKLPRAIICAYDYMAVGAIRCIYNHGLKVPDDIAIIGMDNTPEANFLNPPLSSISFCTEERCKAAATAIVNLISNKFVDSDMSFKSELILRKSTEI